MIEFYPDGVTVTIEFRDGAHDVPTYFARLLVGAGIDVHAVTFEEARQLASGVGLRRYVNDAANRLINEHRREHS